MYNRYIPQPDGSYRRNRIPDNSAHQAPKPPPPHSEPKHCDSQCSCPQPPEPPPKPSVPGSNVGGFLRQLLPKDFDTADLVIVLLLLLMAGDNEKEKNTALLTMALYFIM